QARRELAGDAAFVDVRIPSADVREGDLDADSGFDELRDLAQTLAEWRCRIRSAVFRDVLRGVRRAEHLHGVEGLGTRAVHEIGAAGTIECFETFDVGACGADAELGEVRHGDARRRPLENPRRLRRESDCFEWRSTDIALGARAV